MKKLILLVCLLSTSAVAQTKTFMFALDAAPLLQILRWEDQSPEWKRGWCDATKAVIKNRDHYRALVHFPAETVEESMKRIYKKWPPSPPVGFEEKTIVHHQLTMEMAGIDLYVILSPIICELK